MGTDNKFAVLIDADNISEKYIEFILDEISNDGIATYKRIYGDWTTPALNNWKKVLLNNSILPIQQFAYTTGKNSTDSAMIIDAMDIFYSRQIDGFCLVSSDSDFTRLAARLREGGMIVVGMGERKTPKSFISACNSFKYLDILATSQEDAAPEEPANASAKTATAKRMKPAVQRTAKPALNKSAADMLTIKVAIRLILSENSDDEGWMQIGELGSRLQKRYPDFDVRNFGYNKLAQFVEALDFLETKSVLNKDNNGKQIFARTKPVVPVKRVKIK